MVFSPYLRGQFGGMRGLKCLAVLGMERAWWESRVLHLELWVRRRSQLVDKHVLCPHLLKEWVGRSRRRRDFEHSNLGENVLGHRWRLFGSC
jgi:hypothetical protein